MEPGQRKEYLTKLILGLEQAIESTRGELPYYKEDDLRLRYAKKFVTSMEEQLKQSKDELETLSNASSHVSNPLPSKIWGDL